MTKSKQYFWPLLAGSFMSLASAGADVSDAQMKNLENRVNALEQRKGASGMINPSGRPQVNGGADLFFTADWLIWQAHENGLGYVVKNKGSTSPALNHSEIKDLHYDWDFGFRVGLGYNMPHDGWDVSANWTWFQNTADSRVAAQGTTPSTLMPSSAWPSGFGDNDGATKSYANWRLHLNMIDLEMGREFFVSKWMTLRPFVGLRNAWVRQKLNISYNHLTEAGSSSASQYTVDTSNNYWGLGLRGGLNTQWGLGAGWSFYGNGALSLLYGYFDLYQKQVGTSLAGAETVTMRNQQSYRVDRAIAELAMGIRWDTMFANDRCHFGIQGGWEHLMFFGQNQFQHFLGTGLNNAGSFTANQGDLTIQGWTLAARLDF